MAHRVQKSTLAVLALAGGLAVAAPVFTSVYAAEQNNGQSVESQARLLQELNEQVELKRAEIVREEERMAALKASLEGVRDEIKKEAQKLESMSLEVEGKRKAFDDEKSSFDEKSRQAEALKGPTDAQMQAQKKEKEALTAKRLDQITKIYKAMKPKEAGDALLKMENGTAVAILERLPDKVVGKIFNLMPKDRVRELTRLLEEGPTKQE